MTRTGVVESQRRIYIAMVERGHGSGVQGECGLIFEICSNEERGQTGDHLPIFKKKIKKTVIFFLFVHFFLCTSFVSALLGGPPSFPGVKGVRVVLGPASTCGCFL